MAELLVPLYTDRTTVLYPALRTALHSLPSVVDILVLQLRWSHLTFGAVPSMEERLAAEYGRLLTPPEGPVPERLALTTQEILSYETSETFPSGTFGSVTKRNRYSNYTGVLFDPEMGEPHTDWARLLGEGGGLVFAHGMVWWHDEFYQYNATDSYQTTGVMTLGINAARTHELFWESWYPNLELPQFGYLLQGASPFPQRETLPTLLSAPRPLRDGDYRVEFRLRPAVYRKGLRFRQGGLREISGHAHIEADLFQGVDVPMGSLLNPGAIRPYNAVLYHDVGEGITPLIEVSESRTLFFGE